MNQRLRLFVSGRGRRARQAIADAKELMRDLGAGYKLEVVDIAAEPERFQRDSVMATPMLVVEPRLASGTERRVVGDLSNLALVRQMLRLAPSQPDAALRLAKS